MKKTKKEFLEAMQNLLKDSSKVINTPIDEMEEDDVKIISILVFLDRLSPKEQITILILISEMLGREIASSDDLGYYLYQEFGVVPLMVLAKVSQVDTSLSISEIKKELIKDL